MSRGQRFTFLGIAVVIAVVAVILLARDGGKTDEASDSAQTPSPSATATATATATAKPPPLLKAGQQPKALDYAQGETVRLRVVSDEKEEVHIHGYDIKKDLEPGKAQTIAFKATITGIFEIELEGSGSQLAQLKVVP